MNICICISIADYKSALTLPPIKKRINIVYLRTKQKKMIHDDVIVFMTETSVHIASRATVDSD